MNAPEQITDGPIAAYSPVAAGLAELRHRFDGVVFDVSTTKGDKEAERAAKAEAERQRVASIQERIANDITGAVRGAVGRSFSEVSQILSDVGGMVIGSEFEEFQAQAQAAKDETLDKLREMQQSALAREEAEAQRRAAEEAKHAADMKARNAAPAMLAALRQIAEVSTETKVQKLAKAAIAEAA